MIRLKGWSTSQVRCRELNEPFDDASITSQTIPKPRASPTLGISLAAICLLVKWDPAYRWQESASGSNRELGKSQVDDNRKAISANA